MRIEIKIDGASQEQITKYQEILHALLSVGGLDGVKSGRTILSFDADGMFQSVELDYFPWRRRKQL